MSQEVIKIKKRISSVNGALKVTSAMKLVSTVKLQKWRNKMLANRDYANSLKEISDSVLAYAKKGETPFSKVNEGVDKNLYLVVSSTLGLCGSYNMNIFRLAESSLSEKMTRLYFEIKASGILKMGHLPRLKTSENTIPSKIVEWLTLLPHLSSVNISRVIITRYT